MDDTTPRGTVGRTARALRLASGDSMITLAGRLGYHAVAILNVERDEVGTEPLARQVIGHYRGRMNERPRTTEVGRRIRDLRHAAGHTQVDLARAIGVKPELVTAVEARPHHSRKTCRKIAVFYGVAASELEAA